MEAKIVSSEIVLTLKMSPYEADALQAFLGCLSTSTQNTITVSATVDPIVIRPMTDAIFYALRSR